MRVVGEFLGYGDKDYEDDDDNACPPGQDKCKGNRQ
jgi:hypothetical protein